MAKTIETPKAKLQAAMADFLNAQSGLGLDDREGWTEFLGVVRDAEALRFGMATVQGREPMVCDRCGGYSHLVGNDGLCIGCAAKAVAFGTEVPR